LSLAQQGGPDVDAMLRSLQEAAGQAPAAKPAPAAPAAATPPASTPTPTAVPGPPKGRAADTSVPREEVTAPKGQALERSIRVNVELLDSVGLLAGDLLVESARSRIRARELEGLLQRHSRISDRFLRIAEAIHIEGPLRDELDAIEGDLHLLRDDSFRFT